MEDFKTVIEQDANELIDSCLSVFQMLKYGITEKNLTNARGGDDRIVIIKAPRFIADAQPVDKPIYFSRDATAYAKMTAYYQRIEDLLKQRFEQLQAKRLIELLETLIIERTGFPPEFSQSSDKFSVVYDSHCGVGAKKLSYGLDIMSLSAFLRSFVKYGEWRASSELDSSRGVYFADIFGCILSSAPSLLDGLRWLVVHDPWQDPATAEIDEDDSCLVISVPQISEKGSLIRIHRHYADSIDGAIAFITDLFRALSCQDLRDLLIEPTDDASRSHIISSDRKSRPNPNRKSHKPSGPASAKRPKRKK